MSVVGRHDNRDLHLPLARGVLQVRKAIIAFAVIAFCTAAQGDDLVCHTSNCGNGQALAQPTPAPSYYYLSCPGSATPTVSSSTVPIQICGDPDVKAGPCYSDPYPFVPCSKRPIGAICRKD